MSPALKYTLMQLPAAALAAIVLYIVVGYGWLTPKIAWILFGIWVAKDALLYPLYRHALEEGPAEGAAAFIGCRAETVTELTPEGWVRLRGERWRARSQSGAPLPAGELVYVMAAEGLTVVVAPVEGAE